MTNHKQIHKALLIASFGFVLNARAEVFTYTNGNLILGFQATSGTGADKNVFLDLGKATTFRNNGNQGVLGNIGDTLADTYGSGWYARTDLFFGVIANLNIGPTTGIGAISPVEGDPSRTFYVSIQAGTPGTGALYAQGSLASTALGTGGSNLTGLERVLMPSADGTGWNFLSADPLEQGLQRESDGAAVLQQLLAQHSTAWRNSWTRWNPTPGAGFGTFNGGIQQGFGKGGSATYVDIQRILATNTGAAPTGVVGGGTYVTTISISPAGQVSASMVSTTTSAFATWVSSFPALVNSTTAADRTAAGDFDKDGVTNIREFAFGGSPVSPGDNGQQQIRSVDANADTLRDFTTTIEVRSGATFASSGNKLTATIDGITYTIEGSLDLVTFNSTVSEVSPTLGTGTPKTGYVFKTFRLNAGNGLTGKGFIRAGAALN